MGNCCGNPKSSYLIYSNGDFYIGKTKNNLPHGSGILICKEHATICEGNFQYGKLHGKAIL